MRLLGNTSCSPVPSSTEEDDTTLWPVPVNVSGSTQRRPGSARRPGTVLTIQYTALTGLQVGFNAPNAEEEEEEEEEVTFEICKFVT